MKFNILIVDDDKTFANNIVDILKDESRNFFVALTAYAAMEKVKQNDINIVLLDEQLPDESGIDLLKKIKDNFTDIIVVVITSSNSVPLAIKAIQLGAYHYIVKPFEIEELEVIIKNALEKVVLTKRIKQLQDTEYYPDKPVVIGKNEKIIDVKNQANKIVNHPFTSLLITGETGTGKGNLAKYIHWNYFGDMTKFIHISCADIQPNLLEPELFGYEKGAYTDAKNSKVGLFELANGGTLFLDEIDSIPSNIQAKLLYFLDNKRVRRVGGTKEIATDVRLIAATNANLDELVAENKFRKDFYYRLNTLNLEMPPLRERKDDIEFIARYFIRIYNVTFNKEITDISKDAVDELKKHTWPGNARELKNVIETAMIFCEGKEIKAKDIILKKSLAKNNSGFKYPTSKEEIVPVKEQEILYIKHVLNLFDGHKSNTAKALGINLTTLLYKLKQEGDY